MMGVAIVLIQKSKRCRKLAFITFEDATKQLENILHYMESHSIQSDPDEDDY